MRIAWLAAQSGLTFKAPGGLRPARSSEPSRACASFHRGRESVLHQSRVPSIQSAPKEPFNRRLEQTAMIMRLAGNSNSACLPFKPATASAYIALCGCTVSGGAVEGIRVGKAGSAGGGHSEVTEQAGVAPRRLQRLTKLAITNWTEGDSSVSSTHAARSPAPAH